jgi:hypothetical protein
MYLAVKLRNTLADRTLIVSCKTVDIKPNGHGYHVVAYKDDESSEEFYVGGEDFDIGYVETHGATTHIIRPKVQR